MLQYVDDWELEDNEPIMFVAEDQCWDRATLKQLKKEHDIIFKTSGNGVMPIMILNKDSDNPLFVIGHEDDGTLYFDREYGHISNSFSYYWVKSLIADLEAALKVCGKNK